MTATENSSQTPPVFLCELCDYITSINSDYHKHVSTDKHIRNTAATKTPPQKTYTCQNCDKIYSDRTGLWRHKKICVVTPDRPENTIVLKESSGKYDKDIIWELIGQQKEVQQFLIEQNKQLLENAKAGIQKNSNNTTTTNNTNSHNKFNLNFFLNEQCKNAINMKDFLTNIKVDVSDLEETGKVGYVEGISRIFLNHLKDLDIYERPLHCSDIKRETVYIKDENQWNKEDVDKTQLQEAVRGVAQKNLNQIKPWVEQHPACRDPKSKESETFVQLSHEACHGNNNQETQKMHEKIIKNILRNITINKAGEE
jgi:hypothetical protein